MVDFNIRKADVAHAAAQALHYGLFGCKPGGQVLSVIGSAIGQLARSEQARSRPARRTFRYVVESLCAYDIDTYPDNAVRQVLPE
jgi:hypothetical protein